ncbi:MAG TPA: magnesium transporter CorA family protein [Candidatus Paceibacterota bacterium]
MLTTHSSKGLVWIDMQSPTDQEILSVVQRYGLHPLVGEELKDSPSAAKVDIYGDYVLIILTFPFRTNKGGMYEMISREIDFVIGKNFIITSHVENVDHLEYFSKIFETNSILNKNGGPEHTGHIFYHMVKKLYAGMYSDLENIRDSLVRAEERIFKGDERKMVEVLSHLSRELIDFRETARMHHEVWEDLVKIKDSKFFGEDFSPYFRDIRDSFTQVHELITNSRELVNDLRDTNDSLLNTRQNEIMKTLTIINFIFIPATFISALFTIPAPHVPLTEDFWGWWVLVGVMVFITIVIWVVVKRKKWL